MVQCQQIAFSGLLLGWGALRFEVFQGVQKDDELLVILRISKIGSTTGLNKIENLCFLVVEDKIRPKKIRPDQGIPKYYFLGLGTCF